VKILLPMAARRHLHLSGEARHAATLAPDPPSWRGATHPQSRVQVARRGVEQRVVDEDVRQHAELGLHVFHHLATPTRQSKPPFSLVANVYTNASTSERSNNERRVSEE
jgi:hypothetical protein